MILRLRGQWPKSFGKHQKYDTCYLCSANKYKRAQFSFTSGSTEPEEDETLTGATSADTGVVTTVKLLKGTWAGGDAVGYVEMKTLTGTDTLSRWGSEDENVNGSVGGNNILTLDGYGHVKIYGLLYPDSLLVDYDGESYAGKKLCVWHAQAASGRDALDEAEIDITEDDREEGPDLQS